MNDGDVILAVNAGSSSLKFALYPRAAAPFGRSVLSGVASGLEPGGRPSVSLQENGRLASSAQALPSTSGDGFAAALHWLRDSLLTRIAGANTCLAGVAHRIVHGGQRYADSVLIQDDTLAYLETLNPLAPLHQPHNLAGIRACQLAWPDLPQIACFDTGFHASLPPHEQRFALPHALHDEGIRRYGFHGLSYRYLAQRLSSSASAPKSGS
jgi:acetate kinase